MASEPSKHATEAAWAVELVRINRDTMISPAQAIQRAIDAATADYQKRIEALELKLKANGYCDVCWTCSWEPAAPGEPDSMPDIRAGGWMVCGMCRIIKATIESKIEKRINEPNNPKTQAP